MALTKAYSSRAEKTNNMAIHIHISIAFGYETFGTAFAIPERCVVIVNTVVTPGEWEDPEQMYCYFLMTFVLSICRWTAFVITYPEISWPLLHPY